MTRETRERGTPPGPDKGAAEEAESPRAAAPDGTVLEEPVPLEAPPGHRSGFVTLVGRPNCGKSTLLNALVGAKVSIVSAVPQTTRNRILGIRSTPDTQIVYLDTPGIHKPMHEMNRRMLKTVEAAMDGVDIVLLLVDVSAPFGRGDQFVADMLSRVTVKKFLVLNKVDLIKKPRILEWIERYQKIGGFAETIPVSALTRDNVDRLEAVIREHLPEGPLYFPREMVTDQAERFLISELIREAIFAHTREEIPHSSAVMIDAIEEKGEGGPLLVVHATIHVEKENQKGIMIGARGSMLKAIGTDARREIERILHCRVFLDIRVHVLPEWREDPHLLDRILEPSSR